MEEIEKVLKNIKMKKVNGVISKEDLIKESVIIRKSDLEKLGKELMEEIDDFLHDDYFLSFPEIKLEQEKFDKIVNKSDSLNLQKMNDIFIKINLDQELDEDLYFKKKGYSSLFNVLCFDYTYLEN